MEISTDPETASIATSHARQVPLLEMQQVTVMRGERRALEKLDVCIAQGEHLAILGPNGSGKSTLIRTLTRECYPLAEPGSRLRLLGRERWNVFELRRALGIVNAELLHGCTRPLTGREVVISAFFSSLGVPMDADADEVARHEAAAEAALERMEARHLAGRLVHEMSAGESRRVLLARALAHQPGTLLLDEASNSLDLRAQHELREILRRLAQEGVGLVLVTHHLPDIIPEIERVILLRNGRIAGDGPKRAMLTQARMRDLFGMEGELLARDGYYYFL